MFVHNIDPVLLSIGSIEIRYYGLVYALGFLFVYWLMRRYSTQKRIRLTIEEVDSLLVYLILGMLIGARLFMLFWQPSYYLSNPLRLFAIWQGGMSFHGGLLGLAIAAYIFSGKHKVTFYELADMLSVPGIFILALGRVANFVNAELPGRLTDVSWCVRFPGYEGCRHPSQLYAALKRFAVFGWLLFLYRKEFKPGFIFWNFMLFEGLGRIIVDFWRADTLYLGFSLGQWFSAVMVALAVYFLYRNHKNDIKKLF